MDTSRPPLPVFSKRMLIRFSHCDPAGIVYFPQYLVLSNWLVEDWFTESLGVDFADFIGPRRLGIPIVKLECEFLKPSRQGETLDFALAIERLGGRSLTVEITASANGEQRMRSRQVMVMMAIASGTSIDFPPDLRAALEARLAPAQKAPASLSAQPVPAEA